MSIVRYKVASVNKPLAHLHVNSLTLSQCTAQKVFILHHQLQGAKPPEASVDKCPLQAKGADENLPKSLWRYREESEIELYGKLLAVHAKDVDVVERTQRVLWGSPRREVLDRIPRDDDWFSYKGWADPKMQDRENYPKSVLQFRKMSDAEINPAGFCLMVLCTVIAVDTSIERDWDISHAQ